MSWGAAVLFGVLVALPGPQARATHADAQQSLDAGVALMARGDLAGSARLFESAYQTAVDIGDRDVALHAIMQLGVNAGRRGDYDVAEARFRDGLERARQDHDAVVESQALNDIAIVRRRQGDYDVALEYFARSLDLQPNDIPNRGRTLNNMGLLLMQQGKYSEALQAFNQSLTLKTQIRADDVYTTLESIGLLHQQQGHLDLALDYFARALTLAEAQGTPAQLPSVLDDIGQVHLRRGDHARALEYFRRALTLATTIGDKSFIGTANFDIGLALSGQGNHAAALQALERSLAVRESVGDRASIAETLLEAARIDLRQGRLARAGERSARAVALARERAPLQLWRALTVAGQIAQAMGNTEAARAALSDALEAVEAQRDNVVGGEEERERFFESRLDPYRALIDMDVAAGRPADAFGVAERARSRVLLDALRYGHADATKWTTVTERERERAIDREIALASARLEAAKTNGAAQARVDTLTAQLASARRAIDAFRADLYAAHPELRVHRGDVPGIKLTEVSALLPRPDAAAIEFAVTDDRTYLFVLRRKGTTAGVTVYTVPITRDALTRRVDAFRRQIATRDLGFRAEAAALYALLLQPAAASIADCTSLVLLPDGPLWGLPFHALEASPGHYLIERAAVSYAPSLSVLREMQRLGASRAAAPGRRAVRAGGRAGSGAKKGLPLLVEAEQQARDVGAIYGPAASTVRTGANARADRFLDDAARYRIVHIAAHGVLDDVNPMQSHLVLTPPDAAAGDGDVEAAELMNLSLQPDLMVLSGCDTARGRIGDGEGLIGLSWALFVAGAPSLVVSQWSVTSDSTSALMREFHERLRVSLTTSGRVQDRAAALRGAALALLATPRYRHPFYWAAFVVMGDGS